MFMVLSEVIDYIVYLNIRQIQVVPIALELPSLMASPVDLHPNNQ